VEQGAAVDWYRRMDNNHGFGQYGIPCFAEILFDGRVLPPFHEAWPQSVRNHYHSIAAAVDGGSRVDAVPPNAAARVTRGSDLTLESLMVD